MIEVGLYVWWVFSLLCGSGMSICVVLGSLLCGQEKQKLLSWCLWCTGFFIKELVASISSCQASDFSLASIVLCSLASGQKYSVTFISDGKNSHGFSPNYVLELQGNSRACGNYISLSEVRRGWPWLRRFAWVKCWFGNSSDWLLL